MLKYVLQGGTHYMPIKARELEKRILADGWVLKCSVDLTDNTYTLQNLGK